jgi:urease accessory protein
MTILAQQYLGNYHHDDQLRQQVTLAKAEGCCIPIELAQDDCPKSRITATTRFGAQVGIIKERGWSLSEGDVFRTEKGRLLLIHVQTPEMMVLRLQEPVSDQTALVHLGYVLGNHHWPMAIADQAIYVQLVVDRAVIETTLRHLSIPGLTISYERRSLDPSLLSSPHSHS